MFVSSEIRMNQHRQKNLALKKVFVFLFLLSLEEISYIFYFFNLHFAEQCFLERVKLCTRHLTRGAQAHYMPQQSWCECMARFCTRFARGGVARAIFSRPRR